jgi:AAHS family 4-hydroxybenzoate transporter-like MFS transporter
MKSDNINVREIIDASPLRPIQFWVFTVCILVAIVDGFDTAIVGVAGPALISEGLLTAKTFGIILSAGTIGFVPGMLIFGWGADKWGRKPVLLVGIAIFSLGSFWTAHCSSFNELIAARLFTGLGLGGASPCFVSLAAEYAPQRHRTTIITTLWAGVPGGGALGGLVAAQYLASSGWQALFYFGALVPIVAILLLLIIPESPSYLALRGGRDKKLRDILIRIAGRDRIPEHVTFTVPGTRVARSSVRSLFSDGQGVVTVSLWVAFFCTFGMTVMISQYSAVLLRMSGMPSSQVGTIFSFFYIGSVVGTVAAGPVMNRMVHTSATLMMLLLAGVSSVVFGFMSTDFLLALIGITLSGITAAAAIGALVALATESYPASIRATGVGSSLAISRLGATCGPLLSGLLVSWNITQAAYYSLVGCIAIIAMAAVLCIHLNRRRSSFASADARMKLSETS